MTNAEKGTHPGRTLRGAGDPPSRQHLGRRLGHRRRGSARDHRHRAAGHSIAATFGYPDGQIPREIMLDMVGRIAAAVDLPVSADLDDGYGDAGETTRLASGVGVVGANIEDRLKPLADSVAQVQAIVRAGQAEGVDFALNARTDAIVRGETSRSPTSSPTRSNAAVPISTLAPPACSSPASSIPTPPTPSSTASGAGKVSVIGLPGALTSTEYQELGVARISYGPVPQRVTLTRLQDLASDLYAGGVIPEGTRALN